MAKLLFRLGHLCGRRPLWVVGAWVLLVLVVVGAVRVLGDRTSNDLDLPGTGSQELHDLLAERFPPQQNGTNPIVFHVDQGKLTDKASSSAVKASVGGLKKAPHVHSVTSPISSDGQTAGLLSEDGRTGFAPVLLDIGSGELDEEISQKIFAATKPARDAGITVAAAGSIGSELSQESTESSEVVGLLAAMFILTLVLGSLVAMGLPILAAVVGLGVALSVVGLLGHLLAVPTTGATLATMIGLGVGIDYSLFLISRHQEQLASGVPMVESIARAVSTSGSAIVFAGSTVVVALVSLRVAKIPLLSTLGLASAVAVLTAVLAAITLLPAGLGLLKHRISWLHVPSFGRRARRTRGRRAATGAASATGSAAGTTGTTAGAAPGTASGTAGRRAWRAWAAFVARHPLAVGLVSLAFLVPLIVPAFSLRFGQEDIGATPKSTTERQAYDLISAGFGVGYNGPLQVASKFDPPVKPSQEYTSKYDRATSLKKDLDKKQKQLPRQKKQLEKQQRGLEAQKKQLQSQKRSLQTQQRQLEAQKQELVEQQASLEQQKASLQRQGAALQQQGAQLQAQQATLQKQARQLQREQAQLRREWNRLVRQSRALAARTRPLARRLGVTLARERYLEWRIANTGDRPRLQAALVARLDTQRALEQQLRAALAPLEGQARVLAGQFRSLAAQAAVLRGQAARLQAQAARLRAEGAALTARKVSLERQAASLQRQAAELQAEGTRLQQQAASLQKQGDALQQQADALQKQGDQLQARADQLEAEQKQAEQEKKQAQQLQKQLTAMVTKAGGDPRNTDPRVVRLQNALSGTSGVTALTPPQANKKGDVVLLSAVPTTAPATTATADLLEKVRGTVIPGVEGKGGITSYVGGYTASYADLASLISQRLLLVIGTVILLGFLLLMLAFRSVLIPLQAAATNLLSAAAAFGILTAAFQWGWGLSLLGIDTTTSGVPIASYVPLMMFAVLFGLSMDYEVFLVSHVQQHHLGGEPARKALASGLTSSARITTAACLIMTSVFASFVLNGDPTIKQFGVGLASAVLLAGILVISLAPAAITLMGDAAWWLPHWLDRLLPHVHLEGEEGAAAPPESVPPAAPNVVPLRVPGQRTPDEPAGKPPQTPSRKGRGSAP